MTVELFYCIENIYLERIYISHCKNNILVWLFVDIYITIAWSVTDPNSEKPGEIYVPRDENFGHLKSSDFLTYGIKSLSQNVIPLFKSIIFDLRVTSSEFDSFDEVRGLFEGGIKLPTNILSQISPLPVLKEIFRTDGENTLQFPPPHVIRGTLIIHRGQNNLIY